MLPVEQPFKTYTDLDGKPLQNGFVYFGEPDQNPITDPVTVFWDADGTLPALQPLRTVNGYIVRAGTPANVFFSGSYSEIVQDAKKRQVFYARNSDDFSIATVVSNFLTNIAADTGSSLIGFIQSAYGAVKRTLQDKNRDVVSAFDFMSDAQKDDVRARMFSVDVSTALQACLDHCHTYNREMRLPSGGYRLNKPLVKPPSFKFPTITGEGSDATELRAYSFTADQPIILGTGGSGGLTGAIISGLSVSSDNKLANGFEFDGQCGVTIRNVKFRSLAIGILANNKTAGSFTEYVIADSCDFLPDCREVLVYRRTGGNDSFHGTGVRNITSSDDESGAGVPAIRIGGSGSTSNNIIVYNAPLSGQFWKNAAVPVIQNNSTRFGTNFHGDITLELFNAAQGSPWDLCTGSNTYLVNGSVGSLQSNTRLGTLVMCETFQTRADGTVSALRKPYQIPMQTMAAGANTIATLYVITNETYLVRVELSSSTGPSKKTYLLCVNFAQNAPSSVAVIAQLLDYFGGDMDTPVFTMSGTNLVATGAGFNANIKCAVTVTQIGIGSSYGF